MTRAECIAIEQHSFQLAVDNPAISGRERRFLKRGWRSHQGGDPLRGCTLPFSERQVLQMKCAKAATSMDELNACPETVRAALAPRYQPLLDAAKANTERMRVDLMRRKAAGEEIVPFSQTPADPGPDPVPVDSLPDGPARAFFQAMDMIAVRCAYAVITRQGYNTPTRQEPGPPMPGGFFITTHCDLDGDKLPAVFHATPQRPAALGTPSHIF